MSLVKTSQYWFGRFQLVFSNRGTVDGALYTDANVQLKAIDLLLAISVFVCVLFLVNIWRRGRVLPAMAVGLWAVASVIGGVAAPAFVQRFRVQPAESTMEKPYLAQNIKATRASFGLDKVTVKPFQNDGKRRPPCSTTTRRPCGTCGSGTRPSCARSSTSCRESGASTTSATPMSTATRSTVR